MKVWKTAEKTAKLIDFIGDSPLRTVKTEKLLRR